MLKDFALEDPDLDPADAVSRFGFGRSVIDIGAQRMQRHAAFAVPLGAGDLSTTETARAVDADAFGAETHRRLNGALHGAAESNAAFKLLSDRLRDQIGVDLRLAHFNDVEMRFGRGELGKLAAKLFDVGALLADDDARTRRVDRHAALFVRALDHDFRDGGLLEFLHQVVADLQILVKQFTVLAGVRVPARIPGAVDAEAKADRIDFLAHYAASPASSCSRTTIVR